MKTRRIAAVVLFAFLPCTISLPAVAQDDASTVAARARFKEGVEAFDKGKYEEARLSFLQAYTLKKHPAVLLNLAQSSAKSGHPLDAVKYFQQFLKEATTATPQQRKDAEAGLNEARKQVARIEVVAPAGTEISLDDQGRVGTTPFDALDVEPGVHTVKSPSQSVTVTAVVGQKVEAKLGTTSAANAPVAAAPAPAATSSEPTASLGTATDKDAAYSAPRGEPKRNMVPVYAGAAVAGLGAVSAILFGAVFKPAAQSKSDDVAKEIREGAAARGIPSQGACNSTAPGASDLQSACNTLRNNNDAVDTNAAIANISVGVAVVGALFAVGWYVWGPKHYESGRSAVLPKAPTLTPYAGYQTGGLSLTGEF